MTEINYYMVQKTLDYAKIHNILHIYIYNALVNGVAKPGQIMAIMGSIGAGKTTLLNVLTMRNRGSLKTAGHIQLNDEEIADPKQLAAISGYVQQSDVFVATLKVKEHLRFQVKCFPPKNCKSNNILALWPITNV